MTGYSPGTDWIRPERYATMPYADVNDIRMYYEEHGQDEPLVLLNGATGAIGFHAAGWDDHVPAMAPRYRVI